MTTYKGSFAFLGSAVLFAFSSPSARALQYHIPSVVVRAGERAVVEVRIPIPPHMDVQEGEQELPTVQDELLSDAGDLIILNKQFRRETGVWVWRYELTSYTPGQHTIPPIQVWMGPDNFSTESRAIEITSLRTDGDKELRPDLGPVTPSLPWREWLGYLGAFLAVAAVAEYLRRKAAPWLRRVRRKIPKPVALEPKQNHLEWLRAQFAFYRRQLETGGYAPEIVDQITHTIREYLTRTTTFPVIAWTTREFSSFAFAGGIGPELRPIFERTDRYKFAGRASDSNSTYDLALFSLNQGEKVLL